jgi:hypothetical protein
VKFPVRILGVLLLATVLPATTGRGEDHRGTGADTPPLKMEELEVRGTRAGPGVLYLPVPEGIYFLSPVRLDLIREDVVRPVLPEGVFGETHPKPLE